MIGTIEDLSSVLERFLACVFFTEPAIFVVPKVFVAFSWAGMDVSGVVVS